MTLLNVALATLAAVAVNRAIAGDALTAASVGLAWALVFAGTMRVEEKKR